MKRVLFFAFMLLALLALPGASPAEEEYGGDFDSFLFAYPVRVDRQTAGGSARLPVYAAPFEGAFRAANGSAQVSTAEPFTLYLGLCGQDWCLIEYEISGGGSRFGWVRMEGFSGDWPTEVNRTPMRLKRDADLTDDPHGRGSAVVRLAAGDTVIGMASLYDRGTEWIYAETEADGRTAWLFVRAADVEALSTWHMEGDTAVIHDGVTCLGNMTLGAYPSPEENEGLDMSFFPTVRPGDVGTGSLSLMGEMPESVEAFSFPSTVRAFGLDAVMYGSIRELCLPAGLSCFSGLSFYGVDIGVLRLPAGFSGPVSMRFDAGSVAWYEAEEGSAYRSEDGVLFSADGETLIAYPDRKQDTHYDVPRGTRVIGEYAFDSDRMLNPLKTVSLPLGLERIESRAFCGCGRLQSLTVPLTVTFVSPDAFRNCVSLERLSLPPGITVDGIGDWAQPGDFSAYTGDNGVTDRAPDGDEDSAARYYAYIDPADGGANAPYYGDASAREPLGYAGAGAMVWIVGLENGRACCWDGEYRWMDRASLQPFTGMAYFVITDMRVEPGTPDPRGGGELDPAEWRPWLYREDMTECVFDRTDGGYESITLPARSVIFYTDRDGGRTLGVLAAAEGESVIRVRETPGGRTVARAYPLTQCEVLEMGNGVMRIRTPLAEGWVDSGQVRVVQLEEGEK